MARTALDPSLNGDLGKAIGLINAMLTELYAASSTTPDPSVTTLTASGAISGASVAATGAVTGATEVISGLATAGSIKVDTGTKTASATGGAATLSKNAGVITSEALTTAGLAAYTLTLTNTTIAAADQVFVSFANGTNSQGTLSLGTITPAAGSVVIVINNIHASQALNGTIKIAFMVAKN